LCGLGALAGVFGEVPKRRWCADEYAQRIRRRRKLKIGGPTSYMGLLMMLKKRLIAIENGIPRGLCQEAGDRVNVPVTLRYQVVVYRPLSVFNYGVY
jgi:hypothetical protein